MKKIFLSVLLLATLVACGGKSSDSDSDKKWLANYGPNPIPNPQPNPSEDLTFEGQVAQTLKYVLVDDYVLSPELSINEITTVQMLSEDLKTCGLSYRGPQCLNYPQDDETSVYEQLVVRTSPSGLEEKYFVSQMEVPNFNSNLVFVFNVKEMPIIVSDQLTVYEKLKNFPLKENMPDYIVDPTALRKLATFKLNPDFWMTAQARLQSPKDLRELYHLTRMLREKNQSFGNGDLNLDNNILFSYRANKGLFLANNHPEYVYAAYFNLETFSNPQTIMADLAYELLNSPNAQVRNFAAVEAVTLDNTKTQLYPFVIAALDHENVRVRLKALQAAKAMPLGPAEQSRIILKLNDDDDYVREEAGNTVGKFEILPAHLPAIKAILHSDYSDSRATAEDLLDNVKKENLGSLIAGMSDDDSVYREAMYKTLSWRKLDDAEVPALKAQLASNIQATRIQAAKILAKIKSPAAVQAIKERLDVEPDPLVVAEMQKALQGAE
jgi:hypothetical protein